MNRIMMGVDKKFKEFIDELSEKEGISQRQATREIYKELTGETLFDLKKDRGNDGRRKRIFG